jgi:hypothetical protein
MKLETLKHAAGRLQVSRNAVSQHRVNEGLIINTCSDGASDTEAEHERSKLASQFSG